MNDSIIKKSISKIYFTIVSFFIFIVFTLSSLFLVLQNGLYLDSISLPNIKVKELYIKWNEKLDISFKEIQIVSKDSKEHKYTPKSIEHYFKNIYYFKELVHKFVIDKMIFDDISASIFYQEDASGYMIASSPDISFKSSIIKSNNFLKLHVHSSTLKKEKITFSGDILLDTNNATFDSNIDMNINSDINLNSNIHADAKRLIYDVRSTQEIQNIKYILSLFHINKYIKYWIDDAISMRTFSLHSIKGYIDYDHIEDAYKNLHATATLNELAYKYNPKLDAIHTKTTDIEFLKGVLYIRPKQAKSYQSQLDKSWLKIDFTTKDELLTLHLLFNGMLDKDILHVLQTYKIDIPFLQKKGSIDTDLTLEVNLQTIEVDAKGKFITKKANFDYLGVNLDIEDTTLLLNNYEVNITQMSLKYQDIAQAAVNVKYNAKKGEGVINFDINTIKLNNINTTLNKKLHASYNINQKQDTLNVNKSYWFYDTHQMEIDAMSIPFDLKKMSFNLPTTFLKIDDIASAYISGLASLKKQKMDFDINILNFDYNGIEFTQSLTPLKLTFANEIILYSEEPIRVNLYGKNTQISQAVITMNKDTLSLKPISLLIEDALFANFYGNYNLKYHQGMFKLDDLKIKNETYGEIAHFSNTINLYAYLQDGGLHVVSKNLELDFLMQDKSWNLKLNSLKNILNYFTLLKRYHLSDGYVSINNSEKSQFLHFNAHIIYPYKFFIQNEIPIKEYDINGVIDTYSKHTLLTINKKMRVNIDDDIKINVKDMGFNVPEIVEFYKNTNFDSNSKKEKNIIFKSQNCYLYFTQYKHIISDSINLQYYNHIITAQLKHDKGNAGFKLDKKSFHFYGENFNNIFMEHLFTLSKFDGGSLDFNVDGTLDNYDGIIYIKDTTVLDYKILNNILAFVNTVPSLVTFSLPGYSKKGLPVEKAYMKFHANNSLFNISDIYMDSKELDIIGHGTTDIEQNSIDLQLNLKSDIGSNLQKIPLVGYIILGNDTISTTLSVTGKLTDPKINTLLAKDIVVAPFNIIKRTLLLPFHLFSNDKK